MQQVKFDDNGKCWLETLNEDKSITVEPITSEQAAQFQAENKFWWKN